MITYIFFAFLSLSLSSLLKFFIARENKFYARGLAEKKIYSIRGSQLRRVAQKPIRIRVPAMMDCRSYGKLSVKHNIDPRFLCPTPANSGFTLVAAIPPGGAFCNVGLPTHCHTNLSQPPVSILFPLSFRFRLNLRPFREQPIFCFISSFICLRMHFSAA